MVSRESVNEVFLPDKEDCLEYLREQRWPDEVTCPHCGSADTINKGTTRKDAQRYRCQDCESICGIWAVTPMTRLLSHTDQSTEVLDGT
jgi:transposase-like protein